MLNFLLKKVKFVQIIRYVKIRVFNNYQNANRLLFNSLLSNRVSRLLLSTLLLIILNLRGKENSEAEGKHFKLHNVTPKR